MTWNVTLENLAHSVVVGGSSLYCHRQNYDLYCFLGNQELSRGAWNWINVEGVVGDIIVVAEFSAAVVEHVAGVGYPLSGSMLPVVDYLRSQAWQSKE